MHNFTTYERGREEPDEYLSAWDLTDCLEISINTAYALCRNGTIPAKKIGRQWRISRQALENSVRGRNL